jgi:hypothetical protein
MSREGVGRRRGRWGLGPLQKGANMHLTDSAGQGRGAIRRSYPAPLLPLGLLLATAALALSHAVFPLSPLLLVALFLSVRRFGRVGAWRAVPSVAEATADGRSALPSGGIGKERELLQALERYGEITAVRAALETSMGVAEAENMLAELANAGHVRVGAKEGKLVYALWD